MEFLNKIEIRGIVGNSSLQKVGDCQICRFSVVTELAYKDRDGDNIIESTWFSISAFEGKDIKDLDDITHGAIVHVHGRLKCSRYMDGNGNDRVQYEIVARKVEIVTED